MKYLVVWSELKYFDNSLVLWTIMKSVINLGIITDTFKFSPISEVLQVRDQTAASFLSYFNRIMFPLINIKYLY